LEEIEGSSFFFDGTIDMATLFFDMQIIKVYILVIESKKKNGKIDIENKK